MLKKQDMTAGRVVELLPKLSHGLPKVTHGVHTAPAAPSYLTVRAELESGAERWKVFPGEQLEIIEGPKRRSGGPNCAKVKVLPAGNVGLIFWCELRASGKLIT